MIVCYVSTSGFATTQNIVTYGNLTHSGSNLQFVLLSENTAGAFWMVRSRLYQRELPAGTVLEWLDDVRVSVQIEPRICSLSMRSTPNKWFSRLTGA